MDTDQEVEGLAIIADFQGAELDDPSVLAEYKEIRDAVLADVSRARERRPMTNELSARCRRSIV